MGDYLRYLESVSSPRTQRQKIRRTKANFGRYLRPGLAVLEIGPGTGAFLTLLTEIGITDIDILERDTAICDHIRRHFPVRNSWDVPLEGIGAIANRLRQYDVIMLLQVLEHVRKDKLVEVVHTLAAHLKPGGHLIIVVPNAGNPLGIVERYADLTHEMAFTENSLRQLVEMADLGNVQVEVRGYRIPADSLLNLARIAIQACLHAVLLLLLLANTGNAYRSLDPNISLIITRPAIPCHPCRRSSEESARA